MSNGDDVLDNWEEFDEAGLQSTLQNLKGKKSQSQSQSTSTSSSSSKPFENSNFPALTKQGQGPMKLLQRSSTQESGIAVASRPATTTNSNFTKSPLDDMAATFQPVMMVLHKNDDEYQSANYTQPIANQTVKILRRPTQSSEPRNNGMRPKQPIKTLKQREQEYAEARLRILGSAKNPEDEEQKNASTAPTSSGSSNNSANNSTPATPTTPVASFSTALSGPPTAKMNSPKTQGGPNMYNNLYQQQQQQQQLQLHHNQPPNPYQQQAPLFHPNFQPQQQQQQQQQQQNYFYNQQPPTPAYNASTSNNNRTFSSMPLLGHGPMGAIGQPAAQYQQVPTPQAVTAQAALQQQMKMQQQQQQYHHKSSQQIQKQQQQQVQQQQLQQQTWSPVVGGSVSSSSLRQQQQNESILRLPRGPDGTVGFQTRR